MVATAFDEENTVLGPPPGMTPDQCETISAYQGVASNGFPVFVTCWKVTQEDMEAIRRTGRVWLTILAVQMPPVMLSGASPFQPPAAEPEVPADA